MGKYRVYVPEFTGRRKMTAAQWLAEFRMHKKGDRTRIFDLAFPVTVSVQADDNAKPKTKVCRTSTQIFSMLCEKGPVVRLAWRFGHVGANGLFALNKARTTGALRKDGLTIVHHWLATRPGFNRFMRDDLFSLLSFLEIRPVSRVKTANRKKRTPTLSPQNRAL